MEIIERDIGRLIVVKKVEIVIELADEKEGVWKGYRFVFLRGVAAIFAETYETESFEEISGYIEGWAFLDVEKFGGVILVEFNRIFWVDAHVDTVFCIFSSKVGVLFGCDLDIQWLNLDE